MRHDSLCSVAVLCLTLSTPGTAHAQPAVESAHFWNRAERVEIEIFLDSLGAMPMADATDSVFDSVLPESLVRVRTLSDGPHILAWLDGAAPLPSLFEEGRRLVDEYPSVISGAGPVARVVSTDHRIVLTDELFVRYEDNASPEQIGQLEESNRVERVWTSGFDSMAHVVRVTGGSPGDVLALSAVFSFDPIVDWAYPNFLGGSEAAALPADGYVGDQWHLSQPSDHDINAPEAWTITSGDSNTVIAIIENGGFDLAHPDIAPNLWSHPMDPTEHGWNFDKCGGSVCGKNLSAGLLWHGTAVTGAAAAASGAGEVKGACPDCSVMLLSTGGAQKGRYDAFLYARDNGASVVNASFVAGRAAHVAVASLLTGGQFDLPVAWASATSPANDDECVTQTHIAGMDEVISVTASNELDQRIDGQTTGDCLDLLAPGGTTMTTGVGLLSTDVVGSSGYNATQLGCDPVHDVSKLDYTRCFKGTSAATPLVAGVIGLMLSANPALDRTEVRDILIRTARKVDCAAAGYSPTCMDPYGFSTTHGFGRVDAFAAVREAVAMIPPIPPTPGGTQVELGARLGWSTIDGGNPEDFAVPGSGPGAHPVLHVSVLPGSLSSWMLETQFGWRRTTHASPPSTSTSGVAAAQASYLFTTGVGTPYVGAIVAYQSVNGAGDSAFGGATGFRWTPKPRLALRLEARYLAWNKASVSEFGISAGFGVVIN